MQFFSLYAAQAGGAISLAGGDGSFTLERGAIIGALLAGAAFLAGVAVLRASSAALCALLMVIAGGALEAIWLNLIPTPGPGGVFLLQGLFAAAALFFLSSSIRMIRGNALLGGLMFAAALSMIGIGVINIVLSGEAEGVLRIGLTGVGVAVLGFSAFGAFRGDAGARLILPGAMVAAAAPLLIGGGLASGAFALAPPALFAIGILCASLGALAETIGAPLGAVAPDGDLQTRFDAPDQRRQTAHAYSQGKDVLRVSENQLAQVLDYAGVAVWDWSHEAEHQTQSFRALAGVASGAPLTPETFRALVHEDDAARFNGEVYGVEDGGFDEVLKLRNGQLVRMRGARAVDSDGGLERIVVFLEECTPDAVRSAGKNDALRLAAASLAGAAAAAGGKALNAGPTIDDALDNGEIEAAFQPIVAFEDGKICGSEALVRWTVQEDNGVNRLSTEEIVSSAMAAGKGGALAKLMLSAAARHVAEHLKNGEKGYFAAFNVSPSQVLEAGFVEDVKAAIAEYDLPEKSLVLELTEAESISESTTIGDAFERLTKAGAALAYDDFGSGFSSLSNLHRFNFDYLKVDKSFIDDIVVDEGKKKIVAALVGIGRDFGMTVIAEGIESKEAADIAREIGCRLGQGFHLGAPKIKNGAGESTNSGEVILDKSLKTEKPASGMFRRKVFSLGMR